VTKLLDIKRGKVVTIEDATSEWKYSFVDDDMGQTNRLDHPDGRMILCNSKDLRALAPELGIEITEED